ncbi:hypothetical protein ACHAXR_005521 [Thalassiosira sp. AJA248-18]
MSELDSHVGTNPNTQVPNCLSYHPPRKEDFPPQSKPWRNALCDILSSIELEQPANNPIVLFKNEKYVCTYDKFPKAKYHVLLMRRKNNQKSGDLSHIQTLNDLEPNHLHELQEFHEMGRNIASRLQDFHTANSTNESTNKPPMTMKIGYHALPSLEPLHLHIISSDMDSPCVTTRKHIISFTSPIFFVTPESLEKHLESAFVDNLRLSVRSEGAENVLTYTPMACPRCKRKAATVPDWKQHNQSCTIAPPNSENTGRLNSLLGWSSHAVSKTKSNSEQDNTSGSMKRKHDQPDDEMDDTT